jgi:hypothetical protein
MISELEFPEVIPFENAENETPPNVEVPSEVRAAKKSVVRQTPQRKPTTQIWHGYELPICSALCETTLSMDFWFEVSIPFLPMLITQGKITPPNSPFQALPCRI